MCHKYMPAFVCVNWGKLNSRLDHITYHTFGLKRLSNVKATVTTGDGTDDKAQ